jgi:hypothetical protein
MNNNSKRITQISKTSIVDGSTGVIVEEELVEVYKAEREPDYIKMYVSDIARLNELPKGMDNILMAFLRTMGYNNVIPVYKPIKKMISKDLGISIAYLNKAIDAFHKKGVFIRIDRGLYVADPELFARGSWADIKALRLVIEYNQNGTKQIKSNIPKQMELRLGIDTEEI